MAAAAALSTSLNTPPPPYRRMSDEDRANNSANAVPAYCCLGTVPIKTATFMICMAYLMALMYQWYRAILAYDANVDVRFIFHVLAFAAVIALALIGISYENHLFLIPLLLSQLLSVVIVMLSVFSISFDSSNRGRGLMWFILWLAVLLTMVWVTVIVGSCVRLFCYYYHRGDCCADANNNSLPFSTPSSSPVVPMNGLGAKDRH